MTEREHTAYFARENFRGRGRIFGIKQADRRQHMHVIGKSGTGKTTLLKNLVLQDIENGKGVAVVDPHGEFVEEVLASIPSHRLKDVVYFNPGDLDNPIGFNILELTNPKNKHLIEQGLMGIFKKIWAGVWSARMEYIMSNCVLALVDTPGETMMGISRILVDKEYRDRIVKNIGDPVVRAFWTVEYENWTERFRNEAIAPIQNKVGQFLSAPLVRNIIGQAKSTMNISDIMNSKKIFLVNVSKGRVGEENSALLGAMIITKIQLAAMERIDILESEREDFYLYVDEFQNFATDAFASILSEARKYRLNLIVAHQYIGQLVADQNTTVRDAIFGNVGTQILFRVGAPDATFLEQEYAPEFDIEDMVSLPNQEIYLKLLINGVTSRPFSAHTLAPIKVDVAPGTQEQVIKQTREHYTRPVEEVLADIKEWSGVGGHEHISSNNTSGATSGNDAKPAGEGGHIANCSVCGKETSLPFAPDGRRPVYCMEHKKQVEAGEIPPAKLQRPIKQKNIHPDSLGGLGIEFDKPAKSSKPAHTALPKLKNGKPVSRSVPGTRRASLNELKTPPPKKKDAPNIKGLREALKKAMEERAK